MKLLKVYLFVCIASLLVSAQAETKIISVNYHDSAGTEANGRLIAASSVQGAGDYPQMDGLTRFKVKTLL